MNRGIPTTIRSLVLLLAVAFGAAGCVAYPAGPYGYHGGGWRGHAPAYAYAAPRGGYDGWGHGGGWGHRRYW